jgi:hypothetical protein
MSLIALVFLGVYIAGLITTCSLFCGAEGRFFRYSLLWPWYLFRYLRGRLP